MYLIEEATALLKDRADEILPISRNPTKKNLKRLHNLLGNLLQAVKLPEGTNAKGLITTKPDYKSAHVGRSFDRLETPLET